jgi:hypothetical protein
MYNNYNLPLGQDRDDAEGTWLAFRVVVGEVRAAFVRYRGGMRKMVGAIKTSFSARQGAGMGPFRPKLYTNKE